MSIETKSKGDDEMHIGSKGWYVQQLKDRGIRYIDGKKIEKYKSHVLANLYHHNKKTV